MYHSICLVSRDGRRVAGLGVAHRELSKSCRELQGRVNASRGPFRLVTQISTIVLASCRWLARKLPNNDVNSSSRPRSFHCNRMAGLNSCGRTSTGTSLRQRLTGGHHESAYHGMVIGEHFREGDSGGGNCGDDYDGGGDCGGGDCGCC
ncbi:hypothetical protein PSPO01_09505 [Paraphaeosphaeria sporulosa]